MGNCLVSGLEDANEVIKVITSNGVVMEFSTVVTAGSIADEFPGQAIFRSNEIFRELPLFHYEELLPGKTYYLFPHNVKESTSGNSVDEISRQSHHHVRSNSVPVSLVVPYRMMTCDYQPTLKRSHTDVFSRYNNMSNNHGVWKVKLVITKEQLLEILSQEAPTQELIESVGTVGKFGNGGVSSTFAVRMLPQNKACFSLNI